MLVLLSAAFDLGDQSIPGQRLEHFNWESARLVH